MTNALEVLNFSGNNKKSTQREGARSPSGHRRVSQRRPGGEALRPGAEDVAAVYPELVTRTATGEVQAVRYQELIPMLLNELQRQRQEFHQTLQTQAQALQSQQRELAELRALVGQEREMAASSR